MKKIKKVMAAMTITGIMAAMPVSANAASITPVTTFDVSKQFESLVNKMNDSLLPKEDTDTVSTGTSDTDSANDNIMADSAPMTVREIINHNKDAADNEGTSEYTDEDYLSDSIIPEDTDTYDDESTEDVETTDVSTDFETSTWFGSFDGIPVTLYLASDGTYTLDISSDMYSQTYEGTYTKTEEAIVLQTSTQPLELAYSADGEIISRFLNGSEYRLVKSHSDEAEDTVSVTDFTGTWRAVSFTEHGETANIEDSISISAMYMTAHDSVVDITVKNADGSTTEVSNIPMKANGENIMFDITSSIGGENVSAVVTEAADYGITVDYTLDDGSVVSVAMEYCAMD